MSLWVPHSAFWDWQVDFCLPSLKYFYTLHAKYWVSKRVIIIDSCVVTSWFTFINLQSISQTAKAKKIVFCIVFCTSSIIHICTLKQHSMFTCRQNKHTQRHIVEAENAQTVRIRVIWMTLVWFRQNPCTPNVMSQFNGAILKKMKILKESKVMPVDWS